MDEEREIKWEGKKGILYWILSIFGDRAFDPSCSKFFGAAIIVAFIVGCFMGLDHDRLLLMISSGAVLIGVKDFRENT